MGRHGWDGVEEGALRHSGNFLWGTLSASIKYFEFDIIIFKLYDRIMHII